MYDKKKTKLNKTHECKTMQYSDAFKICFT